MKQFSKVFHLRVGDSIRHVILYIKFRLWVVGAFCKLSQTGAQFEFIARATRQFEQCLNKPPNPHIRNLNVRVAPKHVLELVTKN